MALPKIDLPTYELILPSTKETIAFRPFLVKEEKILMMAMESEDEANILRAIKQIINNCVVAGNMQVDEIPMFDIEYFFLKLRAKSMGEDIELNVIHPNGVNSTGAGCGGQKKVSINVDEIEVTFPEDYSTTVMITDDIGLTMKYPTTDDLTAAQKQKKEFDILISLMSSCILQIFDSEEVTNSQDINKKELEEFLLQLNTEQFKKISAFFENAPKVEHFVHWKCDECGEDVKTRLAGLADFFG